MAIGCPNSQPKSSTRPLVVTALGLEMEWTGQAGATLVILAAAVITIIVALRFEMQWVG